MGAIISYILDKAFLNFLFKAFLLAVITAAFTLVISIFFDSMLALITSATSSSSVAGLSSQLLAAFLPSNTSTMLGIVLSADLASIVFNRAMLFIHTKRQVFI